MASCKLCGQTIRWDKDFVSETTGKLIPLEEGVDERHNCPEWEKQHQKYYNCNDCDAEIYFDDVHISKNGKHIPLDKETGEPHDCDSKGEAKLAA